MPDVRVRFCPSPTGNPHVGMVRTALFNWAFARHMGGTFVFRIEDTDSARDSEESYEALLDSLRWLSLDWDEGPEVGGSYGPYRQSQRLDIYADVAARLLEAGHAYRCYCSAEELDAQRELARQQNRAPGYEGTCRDLTAAQVAAHEQQGRVPIVRFRMPDRDCTWVDLVRGEVTFGREHVPDYVLVRGNGEPLYTLVNPVDDALMRITHVLRGEDLLSSTPRQIALYEALAAIGVSDGTTPQFGHLPYVMGEGNRKLSKRDPESSLLMYRTQGYLPEALLNYLALLGWSMGDDQEFFSLDEMAQAFAIERVSANPARFDLKKCTAINGDWIRAITLDDLIGRIIPLLAAEGLVSTPPTAEQQSVLHAAVPLIQERLDTLTQAVGMLGFLLVGDARFVLDDDDARAVLGEDADEALAAAVTALESLPEWTTDAIQSALRSALVEGLGLKPKLAYGPVRVAITGRRVSPPLFESMEILGRETSLRRLRDAHSIR
ncbi:MAG: glutamate--tRNA ligase [Candidatus Nanopelagicales bacterium]|nr:glutamate--tRNA ligase [Candidatus Nanopelagicales bacterium]